MQNTQNLPDQSDVTAADSETKVKASEPVTSVNTDAKAVPKKAAKPVFTLPKKASATPAKSPSANASPAKPVAKTAPKAAAKAVAKPAASATEKLAKVAPAKAAPKAATKPVAKNPPKASKQAAPKETKEAKDKKVKLVRDSIAIPKTEYAVLAELKLRAAKLASEAKKTEIIRAGIKALASMSDKDFLAAVKSVPNLKTGRPSKD